MNEQQEEISFTKGLFNGEILEEIIFPYPSMNSEEGENVKILLDSWHKFAREKVKPEEFESELKIPETVMQGMKELGLFGIMVPEEYGGFGMSQTAYSKIFEHIGMVDGSISVMIGAHNSIGLKGILLFGTEEQKKKYLPALATGQSIAAFCLTEPGAGSDAAGIQTKADLSADGSHYILNGQKLWITNGGIADVFTVFAKTDVDEPNREEGAEKKQKISAFIVERKMGVQSGKEEKKLGIHGSSTTALFFDNVKVPAENLLGVKGKGFKIAMAILNSGRLGLASGCVGGSKKVLELSVEHAKNRKQFGQPIANFEIIQEKIARMSIETYAAESMTYLTTALVDRGNIDYSLESAICKVFVSETLWRVVNESLQIAAGNGYMKEYPYERALRDARINIIFEGTNEILRVFVALAGMQDQGEYLKQIGKALRDPVKAFGLLTDYVFREVKDAISANPKLTRVHPLLSREAERFDEFAHELHRVTEKVLIKFGKRIIEKEFIQKRIADIAIDLFALVATISRTDAIIREKGEKEAEHPISMCKAYCSEAWRRIRRNVKNIEKNNDRYISNIARDVYSRDGRWF